jgi:hypothetical protein
LHVGRLNVLTVEPPVKVVVKVKLMVVPQTKLGDVVTEKGTVLLATPSNERSE